jgi:protein-L-isoaspartate(D-aspartate) O-methyltransferase
MVMPVGCRDRTQILQQFRRTEDGYQTQDLMEVRFVPLLPGLAENKSA